MNFSWTVFGVGVFGGLLAELLKLYQLKEVPKKPAYLKSPFYWGISLIMALAGGVLAVINNGDSDSLPLALNIGISAPLILKSLAAFNPITPPAPPAGAGGGVTNLGMGGIPSWSNILGMVAGR
jgi:hypothetical protein